MPVGKTANKNRAILSKHHIIGGGGIEGNNFIELYLVQSTIDVILI